MTTSLNTLVKAAYELFAPYTIGKTLQLCKACCVTDAEEKALVETPLRQVSRDLMQNSYYESARNGSDRELWEMKHFLPRVLELVTNFEFPCHSTEITFTRLDLNKPEKWTGEEIRLLQDFALAFFNNCLIQYPLPSGDDLIDIVIMFGSAHFDLTDLLQAWENAATPASVLHLTRLVLYDVQNLGPKYAALVNPFSEKWVDKAVITWLQSEQVKQKFAQQLEVILLGNTLDEETAAEVSMAYELLPTVQSY
ncbi:MAG: hypothetical protein ACRYFX_14740 [Janthinobacterium lividum]